MRDKSGRINRKMMRIKLLLMVVFVAGSLGCAGTARPVQKLTKPVDQTAAELVKVRKLKSDSGETRAVVSPADERQLKITF